MAEQPIDDQADAVDEPWRIAFEEHLESRRSGTSARSDEPVAQSDPAVPAALRALLDAVPLSRGATLHEEARFGQDYYFTSWQDLDPAKVPSRGALLMLYWLKSDDAALDEFMKRFVFRQAAAEPEREPMADDGRVEFGIMDRLMAWNENPTIAKSRESRS